jgi:hypothetical protein
MTVLASSSVGVSCRFRFRFQNVENFIYLITLMKTRIYCNNTFVRAIYVCDILCVITSIMTPRKDLDYD